MIQDKLGIVDNGEYQINDDRQWEMTYPGEWQIMENYSWNIRQLGDVKQLGIGNGKW